MGFKKLTGIEATVRSRLATYHSETAPLLPYYERQGRLCSVDGMADMDSVAGAIEAILR